MQSPGLSELTPLLVDIQHRMDDELNLETLAGKYGYSPTHFQRVFKSAVGESPKKYVERLRLEKAAYKLKITDESVLDIALSVGFNSHETFSRSFKRYFGETPRTYREEYWDSRDSLSKAPKIFDSKDCLLSDVKFEMVRPMTLLSIRHMGDYYEVPDPFQDGDFLWTNIVKWAKDNGVEFQNIPMAILHDDPNVTPKEAQRCDACIPIPKSVVTSQNVNCLDFPGGLYGVVEHIGPYSSLAQAYEKLASEIIASEKYHFRDGLVFDIMRGVRINGDASVNYTDIYLPVEKISKSRNKS